MVFTLTMAVLSLEVALTRIFSFIMHYHFTYLVISVAMLGFGAAGAYLTCARKYQKESYNQEFLGKMAAYFGLAAVIAVTFIPRITFCPVDVPFSQDYSNLLSLLAIIILACAPFFFAGVCIAHIISTAGKNINYIYFADLTGAAFGCLIVILSINWIGAIAACFGVAVLALLAASLACNRNFSRYSVALIIVLTITCLVGWKNPLPLYVPRQKQMFSKEHLVERIDWHIIARLDVTRPVDVYYSFGGALSTKYKGQPQKARIIYQDGSALTGIVQPTPTPEGTPSLAYYLQGAPYQIEPDANALVIGCGGGIDILIALHHGARNVVGVDVNPDTIKLLREYDDFAGGLSRREDVELVAAEGRHFLTRDNRKYDVIQLSGVDTFSALSTGAFALSENFIYTTNAFEQYFNHLEENGIVNISYPLFRPLRMMAMWMDVLDRMGLQDPRKHIMILNGLGQHWIKDEEPWHTSEASWAQTLVKRSPFTPEEVNTLTKWTGDLGFEVIYDPYTNRHSNLEEIINATADQRRQIIGRHQYNITLASDDKPFYFRFARWDYLVRRALSGGGFRPPMALAILLGSLGIVTVLSAALIIYPLYRRRLAVPRGPRAGIFVYFAALGLAFILIEIALMQKLTVFLGGPTYSMAITLFTILLASGIGSFISRNWANRPFRLLAAVIPSLVVAIIAELILVNRAVPVLLFLSHPLRALTAVLMVAPLAILMGMPFPAGLRYVDSYRPELNPWAWGINACATVMGAIVCIILSSSFGFNSVLIIGAIIYFSGWVIFTLSRVTPRPSS